MGAEVNSALQMAGILHNPIGYAKILFRFLLRYLSVRQMNNYIDAFAYLGYGNGFAIFLILIVILGLIDKKECDREISNWYYKTSAVVIFVVTVVMIATALYIDFTPVGANSISGCQHRYITPLLFPVCYTMGSFKKNLTVSLTEKGYAVTNALVFAACSYAIFGDTYLTTLSKMI